MEERKAPPMGPVMTIDFIKNTNGIDTLKYSCDDERNIYKNNRLAVINFLFKNRIPELIKLNNSIQISKMEYKEIINYGKDLFEYENDSCCTPVISNEQLKEYEILFETFTNMYKDSVKIYDIPRNKLRGFCFTIHLSRYKTRNDIYRLYQVTNNCFANMQFELDNNIFDSSSIVGAEEISCNMKNKQFLDSIIEQKIFSYEDIYFNMFESDKVFDELYDLYKRYRQAFKDSGKYEAHYERKRIINERLSTNL
jgi:hypothetical protein